LAMGANLTCGNHCDHCSASWTRERCTSMCLGQRIQKPFVHSVNAMQEDHTPDTPPEKYDPAGADCPVVQAVCGDFRVGTVDDTCLEQSVHDVPGCLDQVLPLPETPTGSDLPNIGERQSIEALEDECRFNQGKLNKVRRLSKAYGYWRPVRGDGNCYYRTVVFGTLEALLASGDKHRIQQVANTFQQVHYEMPAERRAHEQMLKRLRSWDTLAQLERWVSKDSSLDQALIRACRRLVRLFLIRHADQQSPNGLTYGELVRALDSAYADVEEFCLRVVDPMGRDAETLALDALPMQLGVGLRLWILDRRDEVDLVSLDTPGPDGKVHVHVLFKPGHYDLLYPRSCDTH